MGENVSWIAEYKSKGLIASLDSVQKLFSRISEPEIIDLISSYRKMVKAGILKEKGFVKLLIKLGIDRPSDNQFILDENKVYTLK